MKKIFVVLFFTFFCSQSFAQRIKVDEIDKFTKIRKIETSPSWVKRGLHCGVSFYFRSNADYLVITAYGYGCGASVIGKGDELVFLLDNDSSISFKSPSIQDYNISMSGAASVNSYRHEYEIPISGIKALTEHKVRGIRKYSGHKYEDIDIPKGNQSEIMDNAKVFLNAFTK